MPVSTIKRVIQLELNEVSKVLLDELVGNGELPNFRRVVQDWEYGETVSESRYEWLEPWIQWVTVHTGKSYEEHRISHLGDSNLLSHPQIWETLEDNGIESCIFGCMNARRGRATGGMFLPDPWAKVNETYPAHLAALWEFLSTRVQAHATRGPKVPLRKGLAASLRLGVPIPFLAAVACQIARQKIEPHSAWRLASLFDEYLAHMFTSVVERCDYGFNALFLNCVAHYQHHFWRRRQPSHFAPHVVAPDCGPNDDPVRHGLRAYDRILGRILQPLDGRDDTLVLIVTGLSQVPYTEEESRGGMHYYRLNDHKRFVEKLGLSASRVHPLMSRDWQIGADSPAEMAALMASLAGVTVDGEPLFRVREGQTGYLFIETSCTKALPATSLILDRSGRTIGRFHDLVSSTAIKSGAHSTTGSVWASRPGFLPKPGRPFPLGQVRDVPLKALGVLPQRVEINPTRASKDSDSSSSTGSKPFEASASTHAPSHG